MIGSTICRTANAAMPYPISARKTRLRLNSPNRDTGFTTLTPGLSLAHGPPQDAFEEGARELGPGSELESPSPAIRIEDAELRPLPHVRLVLEPEDQEAMPRKEYADADRGLTLELA